MKYRILLKFITIICVFTNPTEFVFSQITLDHKVFLKEIKNSSNTIYLECIEEYNSYLRDHPDDIIVQIEKCRFLQLAQYDEDMDVNPNQKEFDSCYAALINKYPENPEVILYQIENSWGDELIEIFNSTEQLIQEKPEVWNKTNLGALYSQISDEFFYDAEYKKAYSYIQKAIANDETVKTSLLYAKILKELNRPQDALEVLLSNRDTTVETWQLVQKANLLLELKAYSDAKDIFNLVLKIDSNYNNNYELAKSAEGIGDYNLSRKYYLRDTLQSWNKEIAFKNLLIHDLKYQSGDTCIDTYNQYRSIGYNVDPLSLYRLKLFITDPTQPWKSRDILGLITFIGVAILLIIIPSVWILPIYFIGNYWNFLHKEKSSKIHWGLKWFWLISFGYLLSSLIVGIFNPNYFYSHFSFSYYDSELNQAELGSAALISIVSFGAMGLIALSRKNLRVLLSENWSIRKSVLIGLGIALAFKVISKIYIQIGTLNLGLSLDELTTIQNIIFSSRQEIEALFGNYGKVIGFILVCLLVPIYEEVVFRGVILDSCQKHINFRVGNIIQATLFGIVHFNLFLFPVFFAFGIISGLMRKKSQGLLPGIVFHSVNNSLAIVYLLLK
jgi:uncharacterized protein